MIGEQRYSLKVKWLAVSLIAFLTLLIQLTPPVAKVAAASQTFGYPYSQMPCEHWPYNVTGNCANFDWGPVHTEAHDDESERSPYGYAYRNCTDYVAWKEKTLGIKVPSDLGNAGNWYGLVPNYQHLSTPKFSAVAVAPGRFGHVAFVESVNSVDQNNPANSNITVSEYNYYGMGVGSVRSGRVAALGFVGFIDFSVGPTATIRVAAKTGYVVGKSDFNRDSISDLVVYSNGQWAVKSGGGSNSYLAQGIMLGGSKDIPLLGDFNRDGVADFVIYSGGQWAVKSGVSPNSYITQGVKLGSSSDTPLLGDFNGDGNLDFVVYSAGQWFVKSGVGSKAYIAQGLQLGRPNDMPLAADFNQDNIADFVIDSGGQWAVKSGKTHDYIVQGVRLGDSSCKPFAKDFNNDGAADFIVDCAGQWSIKSGLASKPYIAQNVSLGSTADAPSMGDFNGDGRLDFVIDSGGLWSVKSGVSPYPYIKQLIPLGKRTDQPLSG